MKTRVICNRSKMLKYRVECRDEGGWYVYRWYSTKFWACLVARRLAKRTYDEMFLDHVVTEYGV